MTIIFQERWWATKIELSVTHFQTPELYLRIQLLL